MINLKRFFTNQHYSFIALRTDILFQFGLAHIYRRQINFEVERP